MGCFYNKGCEIAAENNIQSKHGGIDSGNDFSNLSAVMFYSVRKPSLHLLVNNDFQTVY